MKYVITGQKGLIGQELKKELDKLGHECVLEIDTRDGEEYNIKYLKNRLGIEADICFHLASNCKINKIINNPDEAFENVKGTYSVFEFCRKNGIKKIVYFSSSRVVASEKNPYVASKLYGEELCKAYNECYDIKYLIIRPSTVYSPGEDKTNRLMNIWLNNAKNNEDLIIYGDNTKTLSFTYIKDFLVALFLILNKNNWNKVYNIYGKEEKVIDVAKTIVKLTNSKSEIRFMRSEKSQPQRVNIEDIKLKKLGYVPKYNTYLGVKECLKK
jgi:nucleoside-diphosphate-sugar epimerase